jgi:lipoprotein-releasing system permease protein
MRQIWKRNSMGYSFLVAKKYIGAGRRSAFITAITVISVAGVALGVLALIIVLAVMNGFESEVIDRIIGTNAHVIVRNQDGIEDFEEVATRLRGLPRVTGVSPFVFSKAMVISREATDALFVRGIDLERETEVTDISSYIRPTDFRFGEMQADVPEIVIGKEVAYSLKVAIGDTLLLARGDISEGSPFGIEPLFRQFVVAGYFDSGMYDYDASFGFIGLEDAQAFYSLDERVSGLSVRIEDMYEAPEIGQAISLLLGDGYLVSDWIHLNRNLFTWMKMEKKVMFIILNLIILVAAFNIASTLIMVVMQRTRDIGILKSMGATSGAVMRIFMLQGFIIGVIGTAFGTVGGIILARILDRYELIRLPGDVYFIETVPVLLRAADITAVAGVAVLICFAATLYPAWQASRLVPVEAIRYE